jgi:DNA-binding IclR family transcriptional regulator
MGRPESRKSTTTAPSSAEADLADGLGGSSLATTLAKGLAVLEAFDPDATSLGNTELAARTGLTRPTVARLSHTLAELGYLRYDEPRAKYRLGARSLRMAYPLLASLKFRQTARPLMQELAESVRGNVSIGLLDGSDVVFVETARFGDAGPTLPDIGVAVPLVRAAMGRALASMLSPAESHALQVRIEAEMPDVWATYGENYLEGLDQCARQGFCVSQGDWRPTISAVAAPLLRARDTTDCFAINCGIPAFRLQPGQLEAEIGPRLQALAASIRMMANESEPTIKHAGVPQKKGPQ